MSETDAEFVERIEANAIIAGADLSRLFALARRGAEAAARIDWLEKDRTGLRIERDRLMEEVTEYVVTIRELQEEVSQLKTGLAIAEDATKTAAARIEQLEAGLKMFACACADEHLCSVPENCRNYLARAALGEKP